MKVLLYIPKAPEKWRDAFVRALPEAEVRMWTPGDDWQAELRSRGVTVRF